MLSNNKGFSLIELMVVVAIIAILSTIAIPSYQSFQAKARQKEGFGLLSAYFTSAQASRVEYGFFPGDLPGSGFSATGSLGYRLNVADNGAGDTLPYGMTEYDGCITSDPAQAGCPAGYVEWSEVGPGALAAGGNTIGWFAPTGAPAVANATFIVFAAGVIANKGGVTQDEYSINDQKALAMVLDGTK